MILSDAFCWFAEEWSEAWSDSMSPPSLKMIQRDKYRRIKGEIVWVALKAPAKAIEEKECGKYISTRTLGTHSITQLNKNCVYN